MKKVATIGIIIISTLCFFGCLIKKETSFNENKNENIMFAIYEEDKKVSSIPTKTSGYYFDREKSTCNNASIEWDSITWSPVVKMNNQENIIRTKCELHFTTNYHEGILNGTDPVLRDDLIPVTIEDNGVVRKANLSKEWYSYADKKWANAIIRENSYDECTSRGIVNGPTKKNGYVSFDGVDDYIDLGYENYDFGSSVSLALRFTPTSKMKYTFNEFFNNFEGAGLGFGINNNNTLYFQIYNEDKNIYESVAYPNIELNKEYTIVGTYDGTNIRLYVNGILASTVESKGKIKPSPYSMVLGANPGGNGSYSVFTGIDMYEAAIYTRVLSSSEIASDFASNIKLHNSDKLLQYIDFTNEPYEDNEIIPEDSIESYFVWIPKYRYQLWDLGEYNNLTTLDTGKVHEIPIIFGDYNTIDEEIGECKTPMESGASGNCKVNDFMTHPAFLSIPSTGFWVGKFETGYKGATDAVSSNQNVNDPTKIVVKPSIHSWRGINLSNAHLSSYNYKRNLDSHVMKNTEWGAVAYLHHSKYGSKTSVRINNNLSYLTGYAAVNEPTCGTNAYTIACNPVGSSSDVTLPYNTDVGYLASTTGNITGIYDMSGGAWEDVFSILLDKSNNQLIGKHSEAHSGFNGTLGCPTCAGGDANITSITNGINLPDSKYYDTYQDKYPYASKRILGDATGELGPFSTMYKMGLNSTGDRNISSWYHDDAHTVGTQYVFFVRGSNFVYGLTGGIFSHASYYGNALDNSTYRIILTPTK